MRRRAVVVSMLLSCGVLALGACSSGDDGRADAASTTTVATSGWNQGALVTARAVADDVVAAGTECNKYEEYNLPAVVADYKGEIPVPLAMTQCKTKAGEDLTFGVFANDAAIDAFLTAKQKIICEQAAEAGLEDFPGFSYVRGPTWLIEPDEVDTADALAKDLDDATSETTTCEGFKMTSSTTTTTAPS